VCFTCGFSWSSTPSSSSRDGNFGGRGGAGGGFIPKKGFVLLEEGVGALRFVAIEDALGVVVEDEAEHSPSDLCLRYFS
jgi:hypothetical protein